ncbi:MAG: head GIN domain-containing protein [Rufibacter sp.]
MKNRSLFSILAFVALVVVSLSSFKGNRTATEEETRNVGAFTKIGLSFPANVVLRQGATQSLRVEGDKELLAELVTEVKDGRLSIKSKERNWNMKLNGKQRVNIFITVPKIEGLAVAGSGKITSEDTFKADDLDLAVSGSGSIKLSAKANEVTSRISGSGSIELKGEGKDSKVSISGSGTMRGFAFEADRANVSISGSGSCQIKANTTLKTSISGSGNVTYEGNASVDSRVSGSGSVKRRG